MWSIKKPDLTDAVSDIQEFVNKNIINVADQLALVTLTNDYDEQKGFVTPEQHDLVSKAGAKKIHDHYNDTQKGEKLNHIRVELMDKVHVCPYCAIGETGELDHFMPRSDFPALALCRLNLVPVCGKCNRMKLNKSSDEFVHPYYQQIQDNIFLKADLEIVSGKIIPSFSIDPTTLAAADYARFNNHFENLGLAERLGKAAIDYINSDLMTDSKKAGNIPVFVDYLLDNVINGRGENDWQVAILRELSGKLSGPDKNSFIKALTRP